MALLPMLRVSKWTLPNGENLGFVRNSEAPRSMTAAELAGLYCVGDRPDWVYTAGPETPANLTAVNGEVTQIQERYTR